MCLLRYSNSIQPMYIILRKSLSDNVRCVCSFLGKEHCVYLLGFFVFVKPCLGFMVKPTFEFAVWFFFVPLVEWEDGDFFFIRVMERHMGHCGGNKKGIGETIAVVVAQDCFWGVWLAFQLRGCIRNVILFKYKFF